MQTSSSSLVVRDTTWGCQCHAQMVCQASPTPRYGNRYLISGDSTGGPPRKIGEILIFFRFFRPTQKMAWDCPKWGREVFFPADPNLANILSDTDFDFEDFNSWDYLDRKSPDFQVQISKFPDFWVPIFPNFQIPRFPDVQTSRRRRRRRTNSQIST